ncbi:MAG: transglycosylase SLT domain-containing protein [Sandaracinus sp.]
MLSLSARVSRVEGRFDEADAFAAQARALDPRQAAAPVETLARPPEEAVVRALRTAGLGALVDESATDAQRTRALRRVPSARLLEAVHVASRVGMGPTSSALVAEAARRPQLACAVRFEIAIVASGTASDESIAALAERCVDDAAYGLRARYVRARALERLGRDDEALAAFREVVAGDHTDTAFYAMWARQRLSAHGDASLDPGAAALMADAPSAAQREPAADAALDVGAALGSLVEAHGEAYPWLARAQELVSIGDRGAAREELHELYLAWLDARGRGPIRAGVEAVYRGATRPRTIVPATLRRMRRNLAGDDAVALAQVAEALGDVGLAIRFGGTTRLADRPRAFEELVTAAAERHELDPNLLLAVMRVESVYDPEIVSYAGAIGLLQIMPRTGRLIAHRLGLSDFRTDDLLDPATNIELAAWYLRSLLDRFEGRLPLAIAAYNGGPHNVRRWMEEHGPELPLDAFLERIPFDQTFRYVRRVLSHYAAYRAQQGLELPTLDTTLPPRATDSVAF